MRAVIQRVKQASVSVAGQTVGQIGEGLLLFLGVEPADTVEDVVWLANKISKLRIFADADTALNLSLLDTAGAAMVISQFTLHAATKKGNRPSFVKAAPPQQAEPLYLAFVSELEKCLGKKVPTGSFGAMMQVSLVNDGPVTIWMDTKNKE